MPTPEEAAKILRAHFGMVSDPVDPNVMVGDPTGSIALAGARGAEESELAARVDRDGWPMAGMPVESFVPGEPGRRQVTQPYLANALSDRARLAGLRGTMAADPFTGLEEQGRVRTIQDKLDTAATIQRPEVGDAADTLAKRNYFAEFMKSKGMKMGELEAAGSPAGVAAAMVPVNAAGSRMAQQNKDDDLAREQRKMMSPSLVPGQTLKPGAAAGSTNPNDYNQPPNKKGYSAADEKTINSMRGLSHMVGDLKSMLNPNDNSLLNKGGQSVRLALYNWGMSPEKAGLGDARSQARIQLADLIKVMGAAPFMAGSRNYQYMKDIYRHLTNPAATDAFLYKQLNELEKRWPQIHQAIVQTHEDPTAPLDFSPTETDDVFGTPPTPEELAGPLPADDVNRRADALRPR